MPKYIFHTQFPAKNLVHSQSSRRQTLHTLTWNACAAHFRSIRSTGRVPRDPWVSKYDILGQQHRIPSALRLAQLNIVQSTQQFSTSTSRRYFSKYSHHSKHTYTSNTRETHHKTLRPAAQPNYPQTVTITFTLLSSGKTPLKDTTSYE
jgi:hypothetical protein